MHCSDVIPVEPGSQLGCGRRRSRCRQSACLLPSTAALFVLLATVTRAPFISSNTTLFRGRKFRSRSESGRYSAVPIPFSSLLRRRHGGFHLGFSQALASAKLVRKNTRVPPSRTTNAKKSPPHLVRNRRGLNVCKRFHYRCLARHVPYYPAGKGFVRL